MPNNFGAISTLASSPPTKTASLVLNEATGCFSFSDLVCRNGRVSNPTAVDFFGQTTMCGEAKSALVCNYEWTNVRQHMERTVNTHFLHRVTSSSLVSLPLSLSLAVQDDVWLFFWVFIAIFWVWSEVKRWSYNWTFSDSLKFSKIILQQRYWLHMICWSY